MLSVTDRALEALEGTLQANRVAEEQLLRITDADGHMALAIDEKQPGDSVITRDENPVLAIADDIANRLTGRTLDVDETEQGVRLVLRDTTAQ